MANNNTEEKIKCTRCYMKFINDEESINEHFGYNRLKKRYQTCKRCRNKDTVRYLEYYNENKEQVNQKIECGRCGSTIYKRNLHKHESSRKCCNNINNSPNNASPKEKPAHKEKPITPSIQCEVCNKFVKNIELHKKGNRCLKLDNLTEECILNNVITCDICGINVIKSRIDDHKLTVGCLTKYLSGITERPFNQYDQWRYDYLMKKQKKKD